LLDNKYWCRLTNTMLGNPVWSERPPSDAWRVYYWMVTKTTKEKTLPDGVCYGLVLGKSPVRFKTIADDLHICWRSVQRSVKWLVEKHLIKADRPEEKGESYRYMVPNSTKLNNDGLAGPPEPEKADVPGAGKPAVSEPVSLTDDEEDFGEPPRTPRRYVLED